MAVLAKERQSSSHWYTHEGEPAHKQPKAKGGGLRPTTLADARKLNLFPSVTTLTGVMDKPTLNRWKANQVGLAAYESRPTEGETPDYYAKRIVSASMEQTDAAASFGTEVHDALEQWFKHGIEPPAHLMEYCKPAMDWFDNKSLAVVEVEQRVISLKRGYAGMADLIATDENDKAYVIDWKTRKTTKGRKVAPYDWQPEQIAAYGAAYWGEAMVMNRQVVGANVFISSTEPGRLEVSPYNGGALRDAYEIFLKITDLWRYQKDYDPRVQD